MHSQLQDGKWLILINEKWVTPELLLEDCNRCLDFLEQLKAFNTVREQEVVQHLKDSDPKKMPISWTGLGHLEPIRKKCLELGMAVRVVIPFAERSLMVPPTSESIVRQIKAFAEEYVK